MCDPSISLHALVYRNRPWEHLLISSVSLICGNDTPCDSPGGMDTRIWACFILMLLYVHTRAQLNLCSLLNKRVCYWLARMGFESPQGWGILFSHKFQIGFGAHRSFYPLSINISFPGIKRPEHVLLAPRITSLVCVMWHLPILWCLCRR
jgi:hypothetical protein